MSDISSDIEQETSSSNLSQEKFKIIINKTVLLKALSHVNGAVERRNIIFILGNVKLEALNNSLQLTATDMDIAITEAVNATVEQQGSLTVPAQMLYDIVRKLENTIEIQLELDNKIGKLKILAGNCNFTLPVLSSSEFPNIECNNMTSSFNVAASEFKYLISKTKFAISTEETRYNLNGIYFHQEKKGSENFLVAVATDGHRLSQVKMLFEGESISDVILPRKTALELLKLIDGTNSEIKIEFSSNKARFTFDNIILVTKIIDATFPPYQNSLPQSNDKFFDISCEILYKAVDRVSTLSIEKFSSIKFQLTVHKLDLIVNNEQYGIAHETLDIDYDGPDLDIAFNARYVLEILNIIDGEKLSLSFLNFKSPAIIKDKSNELATYLLMPTKI